MLKLFKRLITFALSFLFIFGVGTVQIKADDMMTLEGRTYRCSKLGSVYHICRLTAGGDRDILIFRERDNVYFVNEANGGRRYFNVVDKAHPVGQIASYFYPSYTMCMRGGALHVSGPLDEPVYDLYIGYISPWKVAVIVYNKILESEGAKAEADAVNRDMHDRQVENTDAADDLPVGTTKRLGLKEMSPKEEFFDAVFHHKKKIIQNMLEQKKVSVDVKDDRGYTALYWAVLSATSSYSDADKYLDVAKILIDHGASVDCLKQIDSREDDDSSTLWYLAHAQGHRKVVKFLEEHGYKGPSKIERLKLFVKDLMG